MQVGIEVLSEIPPENRREFIQSFKVLPQFKDCKDKCIYHKLFEDVGEMNHFLWVEHWTDNKALEKYLLSDRFKTMLGAVDALGELIHYNRIKVKNIK
ncbi:putative quinol monooxygenase [Thermodesulfobacteriota bacterium]